ncbi:MAG TPA: DegT/DnrJ/EryC1/StrS family aminotransferase [Solirubrobacterales bacterium]
MTLPLFASRSAVEPLLHEIAERQRAVLDSGRYILGPEVEAFESEFADLVGAEHCVGVANGTDALEIGLRALGVGPDDEVMVPAFTFFATAEAVAALGATPVFCDVDPETWCMTAATAEPAIGERTRALVPVHIFGNPAPVPELRELAEPRGIRVLEDAAQAHGAELAGRMAGALGEAAAFSFFPSKNLGGFGDAGALTTNDASVAEAARLLRTRGSKDKRTFSEVGYNSRLDELQAAGLRVLLPHLGEWVEARRSAANAYREAGLADLAQLQKETPDGRSAWHILGIASPERDRLATALRDTEIEARAYYETPLYRQPALEGWAPAELLTETERICSQILALPMGSALPEGAPAEVVAAIRSALG